MTNYTNLQLWTNVYNLAIEGNKILVYGLSYVTALKLLKWVIYFLFSYQRLCQVCCMWLLVSPLNFLLRVLWFFGSIVKRLSFWQLMCTQFIILEKQSLLSIISDKMYIKYTLWSISPATCTADYVTLNSVWDINFGFYS